MAVLTWCKSASLLFLFLSLIQASRDLFQVRVDIFQCLDDLPSHPQDKNPENCDNGEKPQRNYHRYLLGSQHSPDFGYCKRYFRNQFGGSRL